MNNISNARQLEPKTKIDGVVYPPIKDIQTYIEAGCIGNETLIEAYVKTHATFPQRPALVGPEGTYSHEELDDISNRVALGFLSLGLKPMDRVIFQLPNCNELIFGFLGCLKAGLIPVCTLVSHREREIGYLAKHANAKLHFVQGDDPKFDHVAFAERMQELAPSLTHIVSARGPARGKALALKKLYEAQSSEVAREKIQKIVHDPLQVILFHLSGGTTGLPKIIPRFGAEYLYNMRAVMNWNGYTFTDVFYNPTPFMHNFNMVCCSGPTLLAGGAIAVAPSPEPDTVKKVLQQFKPTFTVMGGPALAKMEKALEKNRKISKVFHAFPVLSKIFPSVAEKLIDFRQTRGVYTTHGAEKVTRLLGVPAFHVFGMTEGVIMHTRADDPLEARNLSVGRPVSPFDQIKILKPGSEEELPVGEIGESAFYGPYTTHGYFDAEDRNAEAFTSDGFYRSGDLMSCRQIDGKLYYFFEGRIKDVVDRGGEKINAGEVEEAVQTHPAVVGCAVIGIKDKALGERMCACLVVRDGHDAPTVSDIGKHLEMYGLAKFKWPERIEVMKDLPVTHVGKLDKVSLRNQFDKH